MEFFNFIPLSLPLLLNDIQILLDSFVEYRFGSLASTGIRRRILFIYPDRPALGHHGETFVYNFNGEGAERSTGDCLRMFGTTVLFTDHIISVAALLALRMLGH